MVSGWFTMYDTDRTTVSKHPKAICSPLCSQRECVRVQSNIQTRNILPAIADRLQATSFPKDLECLSVYISTRY